VGVKAERQKESILKQEWDIVKPDGGVLLNSEAGVEPRGSEGTMEGRDGGRRQDDD
jgi:hypothetical protein